MTENLLSSLDTTIARSRAQTVASHAFANKQQQDRFDAYETYTAALKAKTANSTRKHPQQPQGNRGGPSGPAKAAQMPGSFGTGVEPSQGVNGPPSPSQTRNTRSLGRKPVPFAGEEVSQEGGLSADAGTGDGQNGNGGGGPSRVRT
jgi:hypothetical protein